MHLIFQKYKKQHKKKDFVFVEDSMNREELEHFVGCVDHYVRFTLHFQIMLIKWLSRVGDNAYM